MERKDGEEKIEMKDVFHPQFFQSKLVGWKNYTEWSMGVGFIHIEETCHRIFITQVFQKVILVHTISRQ